MHVKETKELKNVSMVKPIKEDKEQYRITFKGILSIYLPDKVMNEVFSAIELSCRRNGWGIAINEENRLDFVQMQQVKESK
jgi:hypothetical protein